MHEARSARSGRCPSAALVCLLAFRTRARRTLSIGISPNAFWHSLCVLREHRDSRRDLIQVAARSDARRTNGTAGRWRTAGAGGLRSIRAEAGWRHRGRSGRPPCVARGWVGVATAGAWLERNRTSGGPAGLARIAARAVRSRWCDGGAAPAPGEHRGTGAPGIWAGPRRASPLRPIRQPIQSLTTDN